MSLRASVTSALFFDNVRVPDANRLPNVKGLKGPLGCLTQARYGITWGPIGAAIACLSEALEYTKERILFDQPGCLDARARSSSWPTWHAASPWRSCWCCNWAA
jgi:glutaryl-CoA dehydrogenase